MKIVFTALGLMFSAFLSAGIAQVGTPNATTRKTVQQGPTKELLIGPWTQGFVGVIGGPGEPLMSIKEVNMTLLRDGSLETRNGNSTNDGKWTLNGNSLTLAPTSEPKQTFAIVKVDEGHLTLKATGSERVVEWKKVSTVKAEAVSTPVHAVLPSAARTTPKSEPALRSARILDASGTESTLRDVGCDLGGAVYIWWGVNLEGRQQVKPFIVLVSKGLQLAIPIAAVTKLETDGGGVTVTYTARNGEKTFTGQPYFYNSGRDQDEEAVVGKSDFGPLKLTLRKIKRLEFSEPGKATELDHKEYPGRDFSPSPATITLADGTTIKASWFVRAWSDELVDDFFSLSRGESLLNIPFKDLAKVEFLENNMVSVTMATGARADMKLASIDWALERTFAGLMGAGEAEYFRVDRSMLKTIEFENKRK
jgi:hypothetical protein